MLPIVRHIEIKEDYKLLIVFDKGEKKLYDCKPWIESGKFLEIRDPFIFSLAHIECGGHAIAWNDNCDLSEWELWTNGKLAV